MSHASPKNENEKPNEQRNESKPIPAHFKNSDYLLSILDASRSQANRTSGKHSDLLETRSISVKKRSKKLSKFSRFGSVDAQIKNQSHDEGQHAAVSWFELFFDLILVAGIIKIADQFKYKWKKDENMVFVTLETSLTFISLFMLWFELTILCTRFSISKNVLADFLYMSYMGGLVLMVSAIDEKETFEQHRYSFTAGLLVSMGALVVFHYLLYLKVERAWHYTVLRLTTFGTAFVILSFTLLMNQVAMEITLAIIWIGLYVQAANSFINDHSRIPVSIDHLSERLGISVIICLGEHVLAILLPELIQDVEHYVFLMLGFTLIYTLKMGYFLEEPHNDLDHALRQEGSYSGVIWITTHVVLTLGLLLLACSLKVIMYHLDKEETHIPLQDSFLCAVPLAIIHLCHQLIRYSHRGKVKMGADLFRFCVVIIYLVLGLVVRNVHTMIGSVVGVTLVSAFIDFAFWSEAEPEHLGICEQLENISKVNAESKESNRNSKRKDKHSVFSTKSDCRLGSIDEGEEFSETNDSFLTGSKKSSETSNNEEDKHTDADVDVKNTAETKPINTDQIELDETEKNGV